MMDDYERLIEKKYEIAIEESFKEILKKESEDKIFYKKLVVE